MSRIIACIRVSSAALLLLAIACQANAQSTGAAPGFTISQTTLFGTSGNDVIVVNDVLGTIRINSVVTNYAPSNASVRIEGNGGDDRLTYVSGTGTAHAVLNEQLVSFATPTGTSVEVVDVQQIRFNANGNDSASFLGTPVYDAFVSNVGYARMISGDFTFEVFGDVDVDADGGGGYDLAVVSGSDQDDDVELFAAEKRGDVVRPTATVSLTRFPRIRVFAEQGGFDSATINDSTRDDVVEMRAQETVFTSAGLEFMLTGFEEVDCRSRQGGQDVVNFRDTDSEFVSYTGATFDPDPSWFISGEIFSLFDGSDYRNIAREFEQTNYFPNSIDSRLRIIDSPGDDYIADPRFNHALETTLVRRNVTVLREASSGVFQTRPNIISYIGNRGGVDRVDGFDFGNSTDFHPATVTIEPNSIVSTGVTSVTSGTVASGFETCYFPKRCLDARDVEIVSFSASSPCTVRAMDSPGNDVFDMNLNPKRLTVQYPDQTIIATGNIVMRPTSGNGGVDQVVVRSLFRDVVVDAADKSVRFTGNGAPRHTAAGFARVRVISDGADIRYIDTPFFDHINAFGNLIQIDAAGTDTEIFHADRFISGGNSGGQNTATILDTSTATFTLPPGNWDINQ